MRFALIAGFSDASVLSADHSFLRARVAAGEAAARQHGFAPRTSRQDGDGYLRRSAFDSLVDRFAMVPAVGEEINVLLRSVDDEVWPFDGGKLLVGPLTAAVDMAGDPIDDRSIDAAMPIIERYL